MLLIFVLFLHLLWCSSGRPLLWWKPGSPQTSLCWRISTHAGLLCWRKTDIYLLPLNGQKQNHRTRPRIQIVNSGFIFSLLLCFCSVTSVPAAVLTQPKSSPGRTTPCLWGRRLIWQESPERKFWAKRWLWDALKTWQLLRTGSEHKRFWARRAPCWSEFVISWNHFFL